MSGEATEFMAEQMTGWVSTLMRDLDAQGFPVEVDEVIAALQTVITNVQPPLTKEEFDEFLMGLKEDDE